MKKMTQIIVSSLMAFGLVSLFAMPVLAYDPIGDSAACKSDNPPDVCKDLGVANGKDAVSSTVQNVIDILFYVIGVIAVIMIIIGGIKYVTSNGDSSSISSAKNTILYAVVGLVVALMSYGIVKFVLNQF